MFRLVNFLLFLVVMTAVSFAFGWYLVTPQPPKMAAKIDYLKDTAFFQLTRCRQPNQDLTDPQAASDSLKPMAQNGNTVAQIRLAQLLFSQGVTNPATYNVAASFLSKSVELGIPIAQNAYGVMVRDGLGGIQQDKIEAYKWFRLAARQGLKLAQDNILRLSQQMSEADIKQAEMRANDWLARYMDY